MEQNIRIDLGERSYDVRVGSGLMDGVGAAVMALRNVSSAVVIADSNVAELYGPRMIDSLSSAGAAATLIDFPAGEEHKTLATYGRLFDELFAITPPVDRDCVIVALGGGVAGDLAGFVAATALRGLRWVQCPTTLLADVDASVGGKTAVDHPAGKNLIGAFHQPAAVVIDVDALKTLGADELRNGLAECVKHGFIRNAGLLDFIEANAAGILRCRPELMIDLVRRNVEIKAAVVSDDERETGRRAHLNFGHTVGHAIETTLGFGEISHGQAVALGMLVACRLATAKGLVDDSLARRLGQILELLGLPRRREALDAGEIWRIMQHDKKARGGKVRMVLPTALGKVDIFDDVTAADIEDAATILE